VMEMLLSDQMLAVWAVLGSLLGTLLLAAAMLWAGTQVTHQGRALWRAVRGHQAEIIAAVDEPGDPLVVQLARYTSIPAPVWSAFLPAFLKALADGLERAAGEGGSSSQHPPV
jgi:hypothetical protein